MPYIATTRSHAGVAWFLGRRGITRTEPDMARHYTTKRAAQNALVRRRLRSEIDSAWHHGVVIEHERLGEPEYADPQPNDGPARLAAMFPGIGNRKIVYK